MAAATQGQRGLMALFKRGWHEIPEVIGSSFMALIGIGLASVGVYNYYAKDGDNRRFKQTYIVYRPDDPRAARVRTD
ncbi:uncharacterized protein NdufA3 [Anabrus simplex]|uniref:uncharacterized protein NdufA3 n=1 Tax=Anabrus simplex TaxID=316456 RepID=UPI0034DD9F4E